MYLYSMKVVITCKGKGKGKFHPRTAHEVPEAEQMYSSTHPSTSALEEVGSQRHPTAALPPGKTRYQSYRMLGGPQSRSGRVRKITLPPGFDHRIVQPVAIRYTDWANSANLSVMLKPLHFQEVLML
jgi:hypothetical protein